MNIFNKLSNKTKVLFGVNPLLAPFIPWSFIFNAYVYLPFKTTIINPLILFYYKTLIFLLKFCVVLPLLYIGGFDIKESLREFDEEANR